MNGLLGIAEQLVISSVVANNVPFASKSKVEFILLAISGFLLFLSVGFIIFGGYLWLSENYGSDVAALMVGVAVLILSLLTAAAAVAILKYKEKRFNAVTDSVLNTLQSFMSVADEELGAVVNKNPKASLAVASTLGLLLGKKFL